MYNEDEFIEEVKKECVEYALIEDAKFFSSADAKEHNGLLSKITEAWQNADTETQELYLSFMKYASQNATSTLLHLIDTNVKLSSKSSNEFSCDLQGKFLTSLGKT